MISKVFKTLPLLLALAAPLAQADDFFTKIEAEPKSEVWIDSGFWTAHFDSGKGLNGNNKGLGAEYRFSGTMAAVGGRFYNSDREWSNYAGVIWQPYAIGPVRVGAALAAFDGYPKMRNGGWFPAIIPTLTYDYQRVGVNIGIIPSYKDRLYGGISLQLKLKVFE
ncbi:hypothetical protein [Massilia sp.]|uniref:hypothetical protein n=1 Tax=Massilia sp. TaxID=1882437 RepID=UPI0028AA0AAC|nr:hypothetical protein [Massilia sp.]